MPPARALLDPVPAELWGRARSRLQLRCSAAERPIVAKRLGLPGLRSLAVDAEVAVGSDGSVSVEAVVRAQVVRTCVVTLEDFEDTVVLPFTTVLGEPADDPAPAGVPVDSDPPEALDAAGLQLGELAIQHLSLGLDPYPRHPNAPSPGHADWLEGDTESEFVSKLARLTGTGHGT
jgi:hypothetical protein